MTNSARFSGLHPPRPDIEERAGAQRRRRPPLRHPGRLRAGGAGAAQRRGALAGRNPLLDGARVPGWEVL